MQHDVLETNPARLEEESASPQAYDPPPAHRAYPGLASGVQDVPLHDVLQRVWAGRRFVTWTVVAFTLTGLVFLLSSRDEYRSGATLLPEKQEGATGGIGLGLLGQFGGLLGELGAGDLLRSERAFPIELYPEVLKSTPVQLSLLESQVYVPPLDTTVTLFTYLDELKPFSLPEAVTNAVLRAPSHLKRWISGAPTTTVRLDSGIVQLTAHQEEILEELQDRIGAGFNLKTGVLSVSATMPDPNVAAQIAGHAVTHLTDYVTEYRLKKLRQNLAFIEARHREAHARFNEASDALARFQDQHQNLTRSIARARELHLQAEYDRAFDVYNALSTQLEEASIQVQKETPVFQTLQPVSVPLKKSYPKTPLVLLLCILLGLIAGTAYLLVKPEFQRLGRSLRQTL